MTEAFVTFVVFCALVTAYLIVIGTFVIITEAMFRYFIWPWSYFGEYLFYRRDFNVWFREKKSRKATPSPSRCEGKTTPH